MASQVIVFISYRKDEAAKGNGKPITLKKSSARVLHDILKQDGGEVRSVDR